MTTQNGSIDGEGNMSQVHLPLPVTEDEVHQIESFFRSRRSHVYVCRGLVNLYESSIEDMANLAGWDLVTTGVPALVWDNNETLLTKRTRRSQAQICIAERGTGFVLWKDCVSATTNYKAPDKSFHTMKVSSDHKKLAGLSFDDERAASDLLRTIRSLIGALEVEQTISKKKLRNVPKTPKLPKKSDISLPCCFEHITSLETADRDHIITLATLVPEKKNGCSDVKRFRSVTLRR
ncbi:uncharacterized protein LOC102805916 [Saccoglossus kowalevskii]|uniref:Uncharacterized protein LOC102805916 n=1 Tax=Saccoglossus kowalevskii TaxID=10224 RepID=A0ABM0MVF0_SACKO|nr:PREDICTED: uncharacterized protein LOC102805916 [Saccoglossus kowalevskii]